MCLRVARDGHPGPPRDTWNSPQCTVPRVGGDQRPVSRGAADRRDWAVPDSGTARTPTATASTRVGRRGDRVGLGTG